MRIRVAIRDAIREGRVATGATLPASRRLAAELGCSRSSVTEAYAQLAAEGYLSTVPGSGTTVAWHSGEDSPRVRTPGVKSHARYDLAPGLPDLREFPRRRWAQALQAATRGAGLVSLGYADLAGELELRATLADYLVRTRGARAEADDVLVTAGVAHAVGRLCGEMLRRGVEAVACEDPGWTRLREIVAASGLQVVPVRIDDSGLRVDLLRLQPNVRAVLVTPAHQFPSGTVMAPARRAALLAWANEVDGWVLEDDYDAEYRFDRAPVATLQGMDPSRVVLLKSVSKVLSPALGLGWMVPPRNWAEHLLTPAAAGHLPPTLDQLAFARLLETGGYDRHIRASRARYRRRRDLLVAYLSRIPQTEISGLAAGLHLVLWLPHGTDTKRIVSAAAVRNLRVADLQQYRATTDSTDAPALVIGYGNIPDNAVREAVQILTTCLAENTLRSG